MSTAPTIAGAAPVAGAAGGASRNRRSEPGTGPASFAQALRAADQPGQPAGSQAPAAPVAIPSPPSPDQTAYALRLPVNKVFLSPTTPAQDAAPSPGNGAGPAAGKGLWAPRTDRAAWAGHQPAAGPGQAPDRHADALSTGYESGRSGSEAIGHDRKGGTSYGKYQISSRWSMSSFLSFLDAKAPDLSGRLRAAGPADTGSRTGAVPDEWKRISAEQPKRFEGLQREFIQRTHYQPAAKLIAKQTGVNPTERSPAMREVLWSTAVQHGPQRAASVFAKAMDGRDAGSPDYDQGVISAVYKTRQELFGSSSKRLKAAIHERYRREEEAALALHSARTAQDPKAPKNPRQTI